MVDSPDPTSPKTLAVLFTRARKRRGWSLARLSAESNVPHATLERALGAGTCHTSTALKLAHALQIELFTLPSPLHASDTTHEPSHG